MLDNIVEYRKIKQKSSSTELVPKNEKGDFLAEFSLEHSEIYSHFATDNTRMVNEALISHIDSIAECMSRHDNLEIRIITTKANDETRDKIEEALDHHYQKKIARVKLDSKRALLSGLMMLIAGIICFSIFMLCNTLLPSGWWEIIDLISWVFLWEGIDQIFIKRSINQYKKMQYNKIVTAEINLVTSQTKITKKQTKNSVTTK